MTPDSSASFQQSSDASPSRRVLILHNRYKLHGGEDVVVQQEAALLREAGHHVDIVEVSNDDIVGIRDQVSTALSTVYSFRSRAMVVKHLRAHRAELLHVHNFFPKLSPSVYDAAADARCAVVQTLHNYRLVCPSGTLFRDGHICTECLGRSIAWPGIRYGCYRGSRAGAATIAALSTTHRLLGTWRTKCHRYITLNDFARQVLADNLSLPHERVCVKPNAIPDRAVGRHRGAFALFVGRLSPEKGIATLLAAAARPDFPIPLWIAGTGPLEPQVLAAAAQVPSRIRALGSQTREQVQELLGHAFVQIVPSEWHEAGGPLTVGEAFAAGVPVITTRLEPMSTVVRDEVDGLLYTPRDPQDLCRAVRTLVSRPEAMPAMRVAARDRYEAMYRPQANVAALVSIYEEALHTAYPNAKPGRG